MATLDENLIRKQVVRFYARVREDTLLGPIFAEGVEDWDAHIERLVAFWSSIMLKSGRYKGNPFAAHLPFASQLNVALFERWLELWRLTAHDTAPAPIASQFDSKAQRIATSLQAGLLFRCEEQAVGRVDGDADRRQQLGVHPSCDGSRGVTPSSSRQG